jgi:hypothetical protein
MKMAAIIKDKQGKEKIVLFFTDKKLNKQIRKIKGGLFYQNHNQWVFLNTKEVKQNLLDLGFKILPLNFFDNYKIKDVTILMKNNYIEVMSKNITKYQILSQFIFFDTSKCFSYKKFDFSKAEKIKFYKLQNDILYIPIGLKQELFDFIGIDYYYDDNRIIKKFKYLDDEVKNCLGYLELYAEQVQAVKACFKKTNGIIDLIGGLGKTEIMLALCKLVKVKTLILTESIDIARQTYERALNANLQVALLQGENVNEDQITICTIQSS